MMEHDVEARLREALRLHAAGSPTGATMLSAVRTVAVRRRYRRHTTWAGGIVVALVLVAAAVPGVLRGSDSEIPPSIAASHAARTGLVAAGSVDLAFPYRLDGPNGNAGRGAAVIAAGRPTLRDGAFEVWTSATEPAIGAVSAVRTPVSVHGRNGYVVAIDEDRKALVLSITPTSIPGPTAGSTGSQPDPEAPVAGWLVVSGDTTADLLTEAAALRLGTTRGAAGFTFSSVPANYTMDNADAYAVTFCPPGGTEDEGFAGKIAVLLDARFHSSPGDRMVVAGGRRAALSSSTTSKSLTVELSDGRALIIQDLTPVPLSDSDLIEFAAGIRVTAAAQEGKG
jgi:hypothetical protein